MQGRLLSNVRLHFTNLLFDVKDIQSQVIIYKGNPALRIVVSFLEISSPVAAAFAEDLRNSTNPFEIKVIGGHKKQN